MQVFVNYLLNLLKTLYDIIKICQMFVNIVVLMSVTRFIFTLDITTKKVIENVRKEN